MRKVNTTIKYIEPYSIAEDAGIEVGDKLISINGHDFHDILEYRYLTAEYEVTLEILKKDGTTEVITVENDYDDIGIEFEEGLIDEAQSCRNKCIFCFIDQLPKGMRETVYFKDDDTAIELTLGTGTTQADQNNSKITYKLKKSDLKKSGDYYVIRFNNDNDKLSDSDAEDKELKLKDGVLYLEKNQYVLSFKAKMYTGKR